MDRVCERNSVTRSPRPLLRPAPAPSLPSQPISRPRTAGLRFLWHPTWCGPDALPPSPPDVAYPTLASPLPPALAPVGLDAKVHALKAKWTDRGSRNAPPPE